MNALITSFQRSHIIQLPGAQVFSAAVYQPKGYAYPKAEWCDIRDENRNWIRPREFMDFPDPLAAYHQKLLAHYRARKREIGEWLDGLLTGNFILCCWCPYERRAREQLEEHGSYVCHTAVVGEALEELGVRVWYDSDRLKMKVLP